MTKKLTKKLTKKQLGEGNYISPEIKTVEFKAEGPLCVSAAFSLYNFTENFEKDTWEEL